MTTFQLGPYVVTQRFESDLYRVFLDGVLIGKVYSRPCQSDCRWLEVQQREQTFYAYSTTPLPNNLAQHRKWVNPPGTNRYLSRRRKVA